MKIFSAEQIYEADKITIEKNGITSTDLMEHAATQLFNWMHARLQGAPVKIHIFCGIGNNGGDGLVLGRHMLHHGYNVHMYVVNFSDKRSKDFLINYDRVKEFKVWPKLLTCREDFPEIGREDIVVDAIFGIGLNRAPLDWVKDLMKYINAAGAFTVSVDVPSGLYPNSAPEDPEAVIMANVVLTFQAPKISFFLPGTGRYIQQWEIIDIGLDPEYLATVPVEIELIGKYEVLPMYVPREKYAHKGTYGHGLIIGGSHGKIGAVVLASSACLRSGAGLVTAYMPSCGYEILQTSVPEAMVITDTEERHISNITYEIQPTVVGLGIGMGTDDETIKTFEAFLKANKAPLVIDADGLNMLAKKKALLKLLAPNTVLTPHPGELERLIGEWTDDFDKIAKTKAFAQKHQVIVLIKGANSITVAGDKLFVNSSGNPGMATAGSGDVLLGMITGFIAQGYPPLQATIFATYLHGRAGDLSVNDFGYQALIASDLIHGIGDAFLDLFKRPEEPPQQAPAEEQA